MNSQINDKHDSQAIGSDIKEAICNLVEQNGIRTLNGYTARKRILQLMRQLQISEGDLLKAWQSADKAIGAFSTLPTEFQAALSDAAKFHMHESHFLTAGIPRLLAYGPFLRSGSCVVRFGWIIQNNVGNHVGHAIINIGRMLIGQGKYLAKAYLKVFRFTPFYKAPILHFLWKHIKLDPWLLIQDYIVNIPLSSKVNPVFKKKTNNSIGAAFVGIDLLPSQGKLYFIEGNFNPGHYVERHNLSPSGDTVCLHLLDWAASCGYKTINFYPHNRNKPFPIDLEKVWHAMAKDRNIQINVIDDPYTRSPYPRIIGFDRALDQCTVLVNGRYLRSPVTELIAGKGMLDDAIRKYNETAAIKNQIPLPREIHSENDLPNTDNNSALPNLIIKDIRLDQGKGIYLYKTRNLPEQAYLQWNKAFEFVPPDCYEVFVNGEPKRFVYLFRAYLLISPDGPHYMGARKDVSSVPIPDSLPFGLVHDKSMFATNLNLGAHSVPHTDLEDAACKRTIENIGNVVFRYLQHKYKCCD
jgi:hypothetical protein